MIKERVDTKRIRQKDDGFSIIELVIGIGIIAILVVLGIIFFTGLNDSAKQSAVDNAVSQVFKDVLVRDTDKSLGDPLEAGEDWMATAADDSISVEVLPLTGNHYKVQGYWDAESFESSEFTAVRTTTSNGENPGGTIPDEDGGIIGSDPLLSKFTFVCSETVTGTLPISNIDLGSTEVLLIENGGTPTKVEYTENLAGKGYADYGMGPSFALRNVSTSIQMNAGVKYEVQVEGTFEAFSRVDDTSTSNCLTSIDSIGKDSGLRSMNHFASAASTVSFPASIPSSVEALNSLFSNVTIENPKNVEKWNVNNVDDMRNTFSSANVNEDFDLSSWDISNVSNVSQMLGAFSVNGELNLSGWIAPSTMLSYSLEADHVNMEGWVFKNKTYGALVVFDRETTVNLDNWTIENSTFSTLVTPGLANISSMNNWEISNQVFTASILPSGSSVKSNMNNWKINNVSGTAPIIVAIEIEGDMNNWTIANSTTEPLIVAPSVKGNVNDWVITDVEIKSSLFPSTSVEGNMNGWTLVNVSNHERIYQNGNVYVAGERTGWTLDGESI